MKKRTIVISGANRGIGLQAAKDLASKGHRVILSGRNLSKVQLAAKDIKGEVIPMQLDVTDKASIDAFVKELKDQTIDVLINNAGSIFEDYRMAPSPDQPLQSSTEQLDQTLKLNVWGPYALTQALFANFAKKSRVDIINMSSGLGQLSEMGAGLPAYRMSKAALNAFTRMLQAELQDTNFYINSLCPG